MIKPIPSAADQPVGGNAAILENQLAGRGCPNTELFFLLSEGKPRISLFDHEKASAPRPLGPVGYGQDRINFRLAPVGDPLLGTVEDIVVSVFYRRGPDSGNIASRPGFGKPEGGQPLAARRSGADISVLSSSLPKSRIG